MSSLKIALVPATSSATIAATIPLTHQIPERPRGQQAISGRGPASHTAHRRFLVLAVPMPQRRSPLALDVAKLLPIAA